MTWQPANGFSMNLSRMFAPSALCTAPASCAAGSPVRRPPRLPVPIAPGTSPPRPSRSGIDDRRKRPMLESAEIGHKISKQTYARKEPQLRKALLNAQFDLSQTGRGPVLVILSGVQAGGRGETANKLTEWMDPRHIRVVAFGPRTPEEAERPPAWRYWRALPPKGKLGIFLNAWYNEAMREAMHARVRGEIDNDRLHSQVQTIREQEQMLTDEGALLLKLDRKSTR